MRHMFRTLMLTAIATSGLALAQPAMADPTVLTFSGAICGTAGTTACSNSSQIGQNYGDSAAIDVSYRSVLTSNGQTYESFLKYWSAYGDLSGVVWGGADAANYISEIRFTPTAGYEVALLGFDGACYLNRVSCQTFPYSVTSLGGVAIASGNLVPPANGHASAAFGANYFADGIILRWGPDGYDGGLDNITFDVRQIAASAVPETSTWAMMIGGLGLVGGALRRRRRAAPALRLA